MVEILVVVMILGVLMSVSLPYYLKPHGTVQSEACINNLFQLDNAACEFALEHGKKSGDVLTYPDDLTPYIKLNSKQLIPGCPVGGTYLLKIIGIHPVCTLGTTVNPPHVMP